MRNLLSLLSVLLLACSSWAARPLTEATFSQIVNDVRVMAPTTQAVQPARLNDRFKTPDLLRTGVNSLAELTAADQTVTRVGANTVFSFEAGGRSINLEQGCLLFHTPKGKGGGTIKTRAASAAVLGTTIVVATTRDGGFKAILLEGRGQVRLANGNYRLLQAGQLVFVLPGAERFGPVLEINLDKLVKSSRLINGFEAKLPSLDKIEVEIRHQEKEMESGHREDTGLLVGGHATEKEVEVVNSGTLETAVEHEDGTKGGTDSGETTGPGPTLFDTALASDVTLNTSMLDSTHTFTDAFSVELAGNAFTEPGFVGRNITFNHSVVDLTAYTDGTYDHFNILAAESINFPTSLTFLGALPLNTPFELTVMAGSDFNFPSGTALIANQVGDLSLHSAGAIELQTSSVRNLSNRGIELSTVNDAGQALDDINLSSVTIEGAPIEISGREVNIENSSLSLATRPGSQTVTINASSGLFIDSSSILRIGGGTSTATLTTPNTLALTDVALTGLTEISLAAYTVNLENVDFPAGSTVTIGSHFGLLAPNPNTGQASVPGYVNFIEGVTYGAAPAETQVSVSQGGTGPGSAINLTVHTP